jgi:hypothetical protein
MMMQYKPFPLKWMKIHNTVFVKTAQGMWKCHKWRFCEYVERQRRFNYCLGNLDYKCCACIRKEACSEIMSSNETTGIKLDGHEHLKDRTQRK